MKEVPIAARGRGEFGKGPARRHRMAGEIPAVVYGPDFPSRTIAVGERDFHAAMRASVGTTIYQLSVDGQTNRVILRDMQRDPVTSRITHVDFYAISENKPLHLEIPITFVGLPKGVKDEGGILQIIVREVMVSCLPKDIPESVNVDVSGLGIGDSIHVADLTIPNVEMLTESDRTLVVISAPTVIKTVAAEAEEAAAAAATAEGEAAAGGEKKEEEKKEEKKK